jgi:hypothetical protein
MSEVGERNLRSRVDKVTSPLSASLNIVATVLSPWPSLGPVEPDTHQLPDWTRRTRSLPEAFLIPLPRALLPLRRALPLSRSPATAGEFCSCVPVHFFSSRS